MATPACETDLAEFVAGLTAPVEIRGGGTRPLGRPVQAAEGLSTAGLTGIRLYEPGALTLVAGAGTPVAEVEAALAAEGQRLPFEPPDHRALLGTEGVPTLGGMVSVNASGPRRVQAGACRDALIGVRFVDGAGRVIRNGGRVMKNVTGYDLVKLLAGAHGTLGVLTEVAFKVLPAPETAATLRLPGTTEAQGLAAMTAALGSPYDVSGAAHMAGETLIRVEGFAASVAHRAARLRALLAPHAPEVIVETGSEAAAPWAALRDMTPFAGRPGAVWRVACRPSAALSVRAALPEAEAVFDWGGGLVWLLGPEQGDAGAARLRPAAEAAGGHATLVRAAPALRAALPPFHPQPGPLAALAAGLRARFDPRGLLNPGRMEP